VHALYVRTRLDTPISMIPRRTAIAGTLLAATAVFGAPVDTKEIPNQERFASFDELERWAKDCFGGGWCTKFTTRWHGKDVELCYSIRTFTSGVATMEVIFWRPDEQGGWIRTVGTSVMRAEFKVVTSYGGCTLDAFDTSTNSWTHWMTISTKMLCNGIPR
jgi:hypothetical protein